MPDKPAGAMTSFFHLVYGGAGVILGASSVAVGIWLYMLVGGFFNLFGIVFAVITGLLGIIFCGVGIKLAKSGRTGWSLILNTLGLFSSLISVYLQYNNCTVSSSISGIIPG
ncbi:MAG: hypothetical protein HZA50_05175 [Planctomycetes bacterium]|nr:hypothetical protein [Planctomycetota bacterium]